MSQSSPSPLLDLIRQRITQHGPMDIGEYMSLCLGHPQHGYYMTRDPFGQAGDFITAPEISQLFGEMIGAWLADLWMQFGSPSAFILLECGPGRGTLMADIMRATANVNGFHDAANIHLMEMSPVLRDAQARALTGYAPRWVNDLSELESGLPVFLVANEFLDALPVRQLEHKNGQWWERVVSLDGDNQLALGLIPAGPVLLETVPDTILKSPENGTFETSRTLNRFLKSMNNLLIKQGGVALYLDYGHFTSYFGETVQAVKAHKFTSIFDTPGLCDLTAHVDFENIARIAKEDKVFVHGPVTQGVFLKNLGIEFRAQKLIAGLQPNASSVCGVHEPQIESIMRGLTRLIDTKQMGSLFKVIALSHGPKITPAGFDESL